MITTDDVVQHIAREALGLRKEAEGKELEDFLWNAPFNFHFLVTDDPEKAESQFTNRFGPGYTFFVRTASYEQAVKMGSQMMWKLKGKLPKAGQNFGQRPEEGKDACLYVYIQQEPVEAAGEKILNEELQMSNALGQAL
jgi:hypothetical protein